MNAELFKSILVCGNTTADIVMLTNEPYNLSQKRRIHSLAISAGGQAANAAVALADLGNNVSFVGMFGNDNYAELTQRDFDMHGIDISSSYFFDAPHHLGFVNVDQSNGDRKIDMYKSPVMDAKGLDISSVNLNMISCMYFDGHEPELSLELCAMNTHHGFNIPVVLDIEAINEYTPSLMAAASHIVAPMEILCEFFGVTDWKEVVSVAAKTYNASIVGTCGEKGCIGISPTDDLIILPGRSVAVVDTTGAGDAFHAAYTHALVAGVDLQSRLEFANYFAAEKCKYLGPRFPHGEVANILKQYSTDVQKLGTTGGSHEPK